MWELSLRVEFSNFCDSKIGWQQAGVSVQDIFDYLRKKQV